MGIYAAAITPFDEQGHPDHDRLNAHLCYLADEGCHGVLLCGTTGEAPSLSVAERIGIFNTAQSSDLHLLAGTGAASLSDTVTLTRAAVKAGLTPVILPPFFYTTGIDLFAYYAHVIDRALPSNGQMLLYHNPNAISVHLTPNLVKRLRDAYPDQITGIKDSSGDWTFTQQLIDEGFDVYVGADPLLARNLAAGGAGAITGMANIYARHLRQVYNLHQAGQPTDDAQHTLDDLRARFQGLPFIAAIKALSDAPDRVRPPLRPLTEAERNLLQKRFA